jgi:hypothetical protein
VSSTEPHAEPNLNTNREARTRKCEPRVLGLSLRPLAVLLCLLACPLASSAQEREPASAAVIVAVRIPSSVSLRIDGSLDESIWQAATAATGFRQREPDNGLPATERTDVRVLYDDNRVIVGATLFDSDPAGVLGNQMQRDQSFDADDRFIVTLDTFHDGRTGYIFQTNPLGASSDGLVSASSNSSDDSQRVFGGAVNRSRDGIWTVRVRRTADGWSVEMEVPFRTINFDPGLTSWGINFQRTIRRKAEEAVWTGHLRNEGVANMSNAGQLDGLSGMSQGIGLDIKPYVVGHLSRAPGRGAAGHVGSGDIGIDLLYNVTPALRAVLSVNTDFAETEVDERQVNLTQFPLFFEEKRDFFLQGATYFDFAREIGNQVTPFFSRRIGLDADRRPQPIDVGTKLSGQAGAFDVGVLHVRTRTTPAQPGADFTVARVRRRIGQESYAGVLYTRRDEQLAGAPVLQTIGFDSALRTSRFPGRKTIEWSNWFLHTTNPVDTGAPSEARSAQEGQNIGRGSRLAFPNDPFYFDFSYRELQDNYNPSVGFVQRRGIRRYNPEVGYTFRFGNHPWLQSLQVEIDWDFLYDMDNQRVAETNQLKPVTIVFADGSEFAYEVHPTYERLLRDFEISDGVTLPAGRAYEFTRHEISGSLSDRYPVSVGVELTRGTFFSGTNEEYQVNASVRPAAGIALEFEGQRNILRLAEGDFMTTLVRMTANTQVSPGLSLVNDIQYDDVTRSLGWQMRFRWIQRPGNDLFVVYTQNWQEFDRPEGRSFQTLDGRAATKVVWTLRL